MRLLADENFPKPIVEALRAGGHDVLWARTDLAGASDLALLDLALLTRGRSAPRSGVWSNHRATARPAGAGALVGAVARFGALTFSTRSRGLLISSMP